MSKANEGIIYRIYKKFWKIIRAKTLRKMRKMRKAITREALRRLKCI